jgi:chorismate mutase/prephenate dehydratase
MTLEEIRIKIDETDNTLLEIYNQRMKLVHDIGVLKNSTGTPIYRPEREQKILDRLRSKNRELNGMLTDEAIDALYLELFAVSRNFELPERIAFLGPNASFTHQAAESKFGALSAYVPIGSIKGVFREVSQGRAKFGVVPIENSFNGIVSDTISSLSDYDVKIIAEVMVDIHHVLATKAEDVRHIKRIYSKDIAFGQCRQFLEDYGLDELEQIPVESTAKAAKLAAGDPQAAAICAEVASIMYRLPILFNNIEDKGNNKTRFFIISDFENAPSENDKTTILVRLPNKPGALVDFLNDFKEFGIDLTKIKSHIVEGVSIFFIEFDGHKSDKKIQDIFIKHRDAIKFLGSYVKEAEDV